MYSCTAKLNGVGSASANKTTTVTVLGNEGILHIRNIPYMQYQFVTSHCITGIQCFAGQLSIGKAVVLKCLIVLGYMAQRLSVYIVASQIIISF